MWVVFVAVAAKLDDVEAALEERIGEVETNIGDVEEQLRQRFDFANMVGHWCFRWAAFAETPADDLANKEAGKRPAGCSTHCDQDIY